MCKPTRAHRYEQQAVMRMYLTLSSGKPHSERQGVPAADGSQAPRQHGHPTRVSQKDVQPCRHGHAPSPAALTPPSQPPFTTRGEQRNAPNHQGNIQPRDRRGPETGCGGTQHGMGRPTTGLGDPAPLTNSKGKETKKGDFKDS